MSKVRMTLPPAPASADGLASKIKPPLAVIGADAVASPALKVSSGVPVPEPVPDDAAMPLVTTVVATQPLASVASGTVPPVLIPSRVPDPTPRPLKTKLKFTPAKGLPSAS